MNAMTRLATTAAVFGLVMAALVPLPAAAASGSVIVTGHVRDTAGQPVAGVTVWVDSTVSAEGYDPEFEGEAVSASTGRFEIEVSRFGYLRLYTPDTATRVTVNDELFPAGDTPTIFHDVVVARPAAITGRITDAAGTPIPNVMVTSGSVVVATSTATGTYAVKALTPGAHDLMFSRAGYLKATTTVTVTEGQKSTGNAVSLTSQAKITGRVFVNGIPADGELGLVAVKLYDATGALINGQGATPTFKIYELPAGDYRLETCPAAPSDFIECTSSPISVAAGEQRTGIVLNLTTRPGARVITYVDGTITPSTVAWGKKVRVTGTMRSYGDTTTGTIELLHHGTTVATRRVGTDNSVTFTLDSDEWGNKRGTNRYKVKLTYTGTAETRKNVDYPTFWIK
jgi:hypothetical protein